MNPINEIKQICEDLDLMGLDSTANRLRACLPLIQAKRQTTPKSKEPLADKFKVIIREGKSESEVFFKTDEELDTFCKMKRKAQEAKITAFRKTKEIYPPTSYGRGFEAEQRYRDEVEKYTATMKKHGQHLELSIVAL